LIIFFGSLVILSRKNTKLVTVKVAPIQKENIKAIEITPILTPTLVPTVKPLSFDELNKNSGPCVKVNVLMYHHIQTEAEAKPKNQGSLTVTPDFLEKICNI